MWPTEAASHRGGECASQDQARGEPWQATSKRPYAGETPGWQLIAMAQRKPLHFAACFGHLEVRLALTPEATQGPAACVSFSLLYQACWSSF